jgi:hypothetical protein
MWWVGTSWNERGVKVEESPVASAALGQGDPYAAGQRV